MAWEVDMKKRVVIEVIGDDKGLWVTFDGKRIAKRGRPGTPQAKTWISLEPGYNVYSSTDLSVLTIEHNGVKVQ
jgi:hypothetical protein